MSERRVWFSIVAVLVAIAAWLYRSAPDEKSSRVLAASIAPGASDSVIREPSKPITQDVSDTSHLADALNSNVGTIRADLEIVDQLLEAFRTNFPKSGNPVGENVEITAALTGKNHLHLALIGKSHRAINARGELCDRWGSPFFFHQLSATQMEIRSAGPDRRLWNSDDIVMAP
jgi:hypothetical protein